MIHQHLGTVEVHCPQLHLVIDERLHKSWIVRPDAQARDGQEEVSAGKLLDFLKPRLQWPEGIHKDASCP